MSESNRPVVLNVAQSPGAPGEVFGYNAVLSVNLGITLAVFAGCFLALGIAELCLPHFPTAGWILLVCVILTVAAVMAILAGKKTSKPRVVGSMVCSIITAVMSGILFVGQMSRIIIVLVIIPVANSEVQYDYVYEHTYFPNGTVQAYDSDPERIPKDFKLVDYTGTGIVMGLELLLILAAMVIAIIESCLGCRPICCPKTASTVMIRKEDGTLVEATAMYRAQPYSDAGPNQHVTQPYSYSGPDQHGMDAKALQGQEYGNFK